MTLSEFEGHSNISATASLRLTLRWYCRLSDSVRLKVKVKVNVKTY